ncbi:MAG: alpha/beta hydrolase [Dehalococcoidia bacterium]
MKYEPNTLSEPSKGWLNNGGLGMHFLDWGGSGSPIVALHGMASSCHWYDLVIPHLRDTFRFVALDQRAHGKTDQPSTGYDWATLAGDVVGALDHLRIERAVVIGHSWGASVALNVAALHPERVAALVMIDGGFSSGPRSPEMTWDDFKSRLSPRDIYGPKERYLGALKQQFAHCWSDKLEQIVMTMVEVRDDGTVQERLQPENHEQILRALWSDPPSKELSRIQCPVLLVAAGGQRPNRTEEFLQRRKEQVDVALAGLSDGKAVWIPDTGHDIGYEKPRELADTIGAFLADRV